MNKDKKKNNSFIVSNIILVKRKKKIHKHKTDKAKLVKWTGLMIRNFCETIIT